MEGSRITNNLMFQTYNFKAGHMNSHNISKQEDIFYLNIKDACKLNFLIFCGFGPVI